MTEERGKLESRLMLRFDEAMSARFEAHARRVESKAGVRISRAEIARSLLLRALDDVERFEAEDDERAG